MTCDHCKNKIGPHQPETYYLCRCGTRYCHTCGHGRSKCEQCGQWNQLETRRS